jgi:hypothetical protein
MTHETTRNDLDDPDPDFWEEEDGDDQAEVLDGVLPEPALPQQPPQQICGGPGVSPRTDSIMETPRLDPGHPPSMNTRVDNILGVLEICFSRVLITIFWGESGVLVTCGFGVNNIWFRC